MGIMGYLTCYSAEEVVNLNEPLYQALGSIIFYNWRVCSVICEDDPILMDIVAFPASGVTRPSPVYRIDGKGDVC